LTRGSSKAILLRQPHLTEMNLASYSSKLFRFGVFEIDPRAGELRKQGRRIKLQEQPFQILVLLLQHRGEVVSRDELRHRLWPDDTFVDFDHSLNTAIMRLRETLGDSSENPLFIETVPKRGYRFIAPTLEVRAKPPEGHGVRVADDLSTETSLVTAAWSAQDSLPLETRLPSTQGTNFRRAVQLSAIILVGAAILWSLTALYIHEVSANKPRSRQIASLVVLPLENVSGDKNEDYFADGMTDDLIAHLAKIRSLRVISRTTAMAYKDSRKPLSEIAQDLNVDAVVEGTVLRAGNRVRITAELVQVSTDRHLWAETYEGQVGDILTLQGQVAAAIVNQISVKLTPEDQTRLANAAARVNPEAYEDLLKGRYYWNKRSEEGLLKAIEYFEAATKKDPDYALAHASLADCYSVVGSAIVGTMPAAEAEPRAKAAALKALEIDNSLGEAETSLASVRFNYDWDWSAAANGFQRAIELNPSYATAYQRYSLYLMAMGRARESLEQINVARQLDPLSLSISFSYGWRLYMARQYDQAAEQLRNTLEMDPNFALAHLVLGQTYEQKGDDKQAIAELQKATAISSNTPLMIAGLGHAYAAAKNTSEARAVLNQLLEQSKRQYVSPFYIALIYAGLGENAKAMDWLEKAYADRSNGLVFLKVDPELDSLRSNSRFKELLVKMRLSD
jgi:TolB-like protein/DNA-binding winged helix-turn-helix (wHTH) protein/Tfp pilus assembly protein PilF